MTAEGLIRHVQSDLEVFADSPEGLNISEEYRQVASQIFHANKMLLDRALELMKIEKLLAVNEVL
mgnify:CR=1 FL=1